MPSDPFVILGIQKGASQSEILEAYKTKRAYYQQHVFDEGEAGADAAHMLEVLDTAYQDAMSYTHEHAEVGGEGGESAAYDEVKAAISAKDFPKAQSLLDDMYYRGGEWHYYQAIIFYEKNWLNESKKQLELAVDPGKRRRVRVGVFRTPICFGGESKGVERIARRNAHSFIADIECYDTFFHNFMPKMRSRYAPFVSVYHTFLHPSTIF